MWFAGKPHRAADIPLLLTFPVPPSGYHEVIVDSASIERRLPDTVLAFFYPANGAGHSYAATARERFLAEHEGVSPESVPLLVYHQKPGGNAPFELAAATA